MLCSIHGSSGQAISADRWECVWSVPCFGSVRSGLFEFDFLPVAIEVSVGDKSGLLSVVLSSSKVFRKLSSFSKSEGAYRER